MNIFDYFYEKDNDNFSKLTHSELSDLKELLNNYLISYRQLIDVDFDYSFGMEIEASYVSEYILARIASRYNYDEHTDYSTCNGSEIATSIMWDNMIMWQSFKDCLDDINEVTKSVKDCGGHIHIGAHILEGTFANFKRFLRLYEAYEHIINRFLYGEFLSHRYSLKKYAPPVSNRIFENFYLFDSRDIEERIEGCYDIGCKLGLEHNQMSNQYSALNLRKVSDYDPEVFSKNNTIEFRSPNGTLNPIIWQNNVLFCIKLLECAKKNKSKDFIKSLENKVYEKRYLAGNLNEYRKIHLDDALELCDLIYDNNLDKINFLRQYTKDFKEITHGQVRAKEFTDYNLTKSK